MYRCGNSLYIWFTRPFSHSSMSAFARLFSWVSSFTERNARNGFRRSVVAEWASTKVYRISTRGSKLTSMRSLVSTTPPTR